MCNEIAASLTEFLRQRFEVNEELISLLIPFVQVDDQNVNLRKIHAVFGSDSDLQEFSCEFSELVCQKKLIDMKLPDLVAKLSSNADSYPSVLSVLSRILLPSHTQLMLKGALAQITFLKHVYVQV